MATLLLLAFRVIFSVSSSESVFTSYLSVPITTEWRLPLVKSFLLFWPSACVFRVRRAWMAGKRLVFQNQPIY